MPKENALDLTILENSKTASLWQRFGAKKRAGVLAPVFSLYSKDSCGIGEIPDIAQLCSWCKKSGLSIIQLLPMNDTGFDFAPYAAQSTFALDPMYLRLSDIKGVNHAVFSKDITKLKTKYPAGKKRVNYEIKGAKLKILFDMFSDFSRLDPEYIKYKKTNKFWLNDYALYKALKEKYDQKSWEDWPEALRLREAGALSDFEMKFPDTVEFYRFQQYQLYLQFSSVKKAVNDAGVFIQGDLPFLVSRDSADVWAHQSYFKMNLVAGAPPDMYFAKGQRWGMPPYNWEVIEEHGYDYLSEKVKYSGNFYDMFRIDHFVGLFRLWTIREEENHDTYGLNGTFDPVNEDEWKEHGTKILDVMMNSSDMLPCAEDLGVVPQCSYETLLEYGIPGMDVQRWTRDWGNTYEFKKPSEYRVNSSAIISSHDMSPLALWWQEEAGTVDALLVEKLCEDNTINHKETLAALFDLMRSSKSRLRFKKSLKEPEDVLSALNLTRAEAWMFYDLFREAADEKKQFYKMIGLTGEPSDFADPVFTAAAIKTCMETESVFSIQLLQDYLCLGNTFDAWDKHELRINTPGLVSALNWSIVMPLSLEEMNESGICGEIKNIATLTGRI